MDLLVQLEAGLPDNYSTSGLVWWVACLSSSGAVSAIKNVGRRSTPKMVAKQSISVLVLVVRVLCGPDTS